MREIYGNHDRLVLEQKLSAKCCNTQ